MGMRIFRQACRAKFSAGMFLNEPGVGLEQQREKTLMLVTCVIELVDDCNETTAPICVCFLHLFFSLLGNTFLGIQAFSDMVSRLVHLGKHLRNPINVHHSTLD